MEEGREKCEMFLNYYFVCFRTFVLDPSSHNYLQALSFYTLVFPGGIISVSGSFDVFMVKADYCGLMELTNCIYDDT